MRGYPYGVVSKIFQNYTVHVLCNFCYHEHRLRLDSRKLRFIDKIQSNLHVDLWKTSQFFLIHYNKMYFLTALNLIRYLGCEANHELCYCQLRVDLMFEA